MFRFRSLLTAAFALSLLVASTACATDFLRLNVGHGHQVQRVQLVQQVQYVQQPVVLQQVQYAPLQQVRFVQQQYAAPLVVQNRQFVQQRFVQPVVIRQQQFVRRPQAAVQLRFNFGR
jgi:hypothetical protein